MFFFEVVSFLIFWPILWWLGGRLARDDAPASPRRSPPDLPANVVDLAAYRRAQRASDPRRARS